MSKRIQYLQDTGTGILPTSMFPLPLPACSLTLKSTPALTKCLDWAERVLTDGAGDIPASISRSLYASHKGSLEEAYWGHLSVTIDFFLKFVEEEENLDYYPKGVKVIQDRTRKELEQAIAWGRAGDLTEMVLKDYAEALSRCRHLCAATHLGYLPEHTDPMVFTKQDVEKTMSDTEDWVCHLSYRHIRDQLQREASSGRVAPL